MSKKARTLLGAIDPEKRKKVSEFIDFLTKHNSFVKYQNNLEAKRKDVLYFITYSNITEAFVWDETPEGYDYWQHINRLWTLRKAR